MNFQAEKAQRLRRLEILRAEQQTGAGSKPIEESEDAIERDYFRKVERYLDKGAGECVLRRPDIAELTMGAVRFFENQRYRLDAWIIMPNHVHVVFWPMPNQVVSDLVKSWKQFVALRANRILKRVGTDLWQREPFDHWIRNDEEHAPCCRDVIFNPVKAGLCAAPGDWRWSSAWSAVPSS
jgi:REP element-mobilizing transposase RayT